MDEDAPVPVNKLSVIGASDFFILWQEILATRLQRVAFNYLQDLSFYQMPHDFVFATDWNQRDDHSKSDRISHVA